MAKTRNFDGLADSVKSFLQAIGHDQDPETDKTPERVTEFWSQHLLIGEELSKSLQVEGMPAETQDPIIMRDVDLHIVCPHHLTIGMGKGTLGYIPGEEWFGLGTLAKILEAATAKCTLQERLSKPRLSVRSQHRLKRSWQVPYISEICGKKLSDWDG